MPITNLNYVDCNMLLNGGRVGESGTEEIMVLLFEGGLYDQLPTEFVLLILTTKLSFLDVSPKSFLRLSRVIKHKKEDYFI